MPATDEPHQPTWTAERRITVGLPVYNDAESLYASVPTVFGQSYDGPLRLLVVDDGSTDRTPQVLAELAERYGRIEVITNTTNRGRPAARNQVLEAAGDDLLAWIDADDLWRPRKLELQLAALAKASPAGTEPVICTVPFRWVYRDRGQLNVRVPDVEGDQLYNCLAGTLQPYLWAMLGRAELFRAAGGFDERLRRRQDFEFLIRFLAGGGRMVRTDAAVPLATYMKSDAGRSADEVSAANDVIWAKHAPLYRRYGRRFALESRRSHYRLSARFHEHNEARLERSKFALRAGGLNPLIWVTPPQVNVGDPLRVPKWLYWGTRRRVKAARNLARRTRRQARRWRRNATRTVTRQTQRQRTRAKRALATAGLSGGWDMWRLARSLPLSAWVAEEPVATVLDRAEAHTAGAPPDAGRGVWLQLEKLYRNAGELWSAEQTLERGLARHPGDPRLTVRRIELLGLRREWERCVDAWEALDPAALEEAVATTYVRVARALRELGRRDEAAKAAAAGMARFPDDARLVAEYRRNQAALTDWRAAVAAGGGATVAGGAGSRIEGAVGAATSLGFLEGSDGPIQGWLHAVDGRAPDVELLLNGARVNVTSATPSGQHDTAAFALSCVELGEYLGDGDVLELRTADGPIVWEGIGPALLVEPGQPSRADELIDRVARGHVFNKFGRLLSGNTTKRKIAVLNLYEEVAAVVAERTGLTLVPFYGNLLGAVREHDFVSHDVGGFDVAYLSTQPSPAGVRAEFLAACRGLVEAGYDLTLEPFSVMVRRQSAKPTLVDINFCWVAEDGGLGMSYGWRYEPVTDLAAFRAPRRAAMADRLVPVPGNAEAVLYQIYGRGWLVPDQGFQLDVGLQRDERYLITPAEREELAGLDPDRVHLKPDPEHAA